MWENDYHHQHSQRYFEGSRSFPLSLPPHYRPHYLETPPGYENRTTCQNNVDKVCERVCVLVSPHLNAFR